MRWTVISKSHLQKKPKLERLERVKLIRQGNRWVRINPFVHQQQQPLSLPPSTETQLPSPSTEATVHQQQQPLSLPPSTETHLPSPSPSTEATVHHQLPPPSKLDNIDINFDPLLSTVNQVAPLTHTLMPLLVSNRNVFDYLGEEFPVLDFDVLLS